MKHLLIVLLLAIGIGAQAQTAELRISPNVITTDKNGGVIEKGDTILTDYTQKQEFIKLINATHFSFLRHDLTKGKGKDAVFSAGGGTYTLQGNKYSEYLQYCNYREWENNHFDFTLKLENDTLTQEGREKIDSLGVDRLNVEKYIRVK